MNVFPNVQEKNDVFPQRAGQSCPFRPGVPLGINALRPTGRQKVFQKGKAARSYLI